MKKQLTFGMIPIIMLGLLVAFFGGCKKEELPTLTTLSVSEITANSGKSGGNITSDGGGEITSRGTVWAENENPSIEQHVEITSDGVGKGLFTSNITKLSPGTTYYVRAYAVNGAGTSYGNQVTFSTINPLVANFTGSPTSGTAPLTVSFTDQSTKSPTSWNWSFGDGATSIQQSPSHTYSTPGNYTVKLTVENNDVSSTETKENYIQVSSGQGIETGTFTDTRDDQTYKWVKIGEQVWMAENLNFASDYSWCYDNNSTNCDHYGRLYVWEAAMNWASSSNENPSGVQGVCPPGWHVPSNTEWTELVNYVVSQGYQNNDHTEFDGAGNALKSCRQVGSPLGGACNTSDHPRWNFNGTHYGTDEFGFSALPGGFIRYRDESSDYVGELCLWWSSTQLGLTHAYYHLMHCNYSDVYRNFEMKSVGYSLRCVRD